MRHKGGLDYLHATHSDSDFEFEAQLRPIGHWFWQNMLETMQEEFLKLEIEEMRSRMLHRKSVGICMLLNVCAPASAPAVTNPSQARHEPSRIVTHDDQSSAKSVGPTLGVISGGTHPRRPMLPRQTVVSRWIGS